jgi:mRNA interferase HigB
VKLPALVPELGTCYPDVVRVVAYGRLRDFWTRHPETEVGLLHWFETVRQANWKTTLEVVRGVARSKALSSNRVRSAIHGGSYRLIAAFDFRRGVVFIKFLGTHAEYDRIDALTVAQF